MIELRKALPPDAEAIAGLMRLAIAELQRSFLEPEQIEASRLQMGLDLALIEDGTYFCVEERQSLVGCGGWSRRATRYGGDHSPGRDSRLLDPRAEPARIRAMYTHPDHVRRGIGRLILAAAEDAARAEGFSQVELVSTMAGKPFYAACGFRLESEWDDRAGTVPVPLATMTKQLA